MSIELVMPSNRVILYRPHLLPPSVFPSIRVRTEVEKKQSLQTVAQSVLGPFLSP